MMQTVHRSVNKINSSVILLLVILVFNPQQILPQTPLNYKSINTKNGLRDDIATAIAQDRMGYMWFGTRSGLVRYDGSNFTNYNFDPDFPDGLSGNQINALNVDKKGTLWIGTINGLCYFDRNLNRPVKIKIIIRGNGINPPIKRIDSDNNGIVWMATANDGLISFNPDTKIFTQYKYDKDNKNGMLSNQVNTVFCASDNTIWVGTNKGLNHYYPETKKFESYVSETGINPALSDNNVLSIAEGNKSDLWIGTANGLDHLNPDKNKITIYKNQPGNINSISNHFVNALLFDKKFLWIGAGFGSNILNKMDVGSGKITRYKFSTNEINVNFLGRMLDIKKDNTGIIWIAQSYGGVRYFDPRWQNYTQFVIKPDNKGDLINSTYGALPVSSTIFWVSTVKGLVKYDINKGLIKDYSSLSPVQVPYLDNAAIEINNKLWVPTKNIGIMILDLKSGNLKDLKYEKNNSHSISSNFVNILIKDSDGIVWAGSRNGGLDRIDPVTGKITRYHHDPNNPNSLPDNNIFALLDKDQSHLWVGSNSGLALFNKKTGLSKIYSYNPDDSTSISSNQISYLARDKKGRLWVSAYGGGLDLFIPSGNKFERFTSQKGNIPDNTIYSTIEDNSGNLWVSTSVGVARFLPDKESFDFLLPFRDNYRGTKLPNGELLFSGPHGLLIFDPDKMSYNASPPEVSISKLNINGKEVLPGQGSVLKVNISQTKKIELNYNQNDIGFEFFASHYSNPALNKYSVYLDGYDNQWRDLGNLNYINYTNLDPGKYVLKLKAASAYNVWTNKPDELEIIINPPLWETWWAYSLYFIFGFGFLFSVRQFELNRRKEKENKHLLEIENERKSKELEEARRLQLSLLPKALPQPSNLEIAVHMQTATEVGGDYYDFAVGLDGTLNIALGDATGHGMQAGTLVTIMKGIFTLDAENSDVLPFFQKSVRAIKEIKLGRLLMAFAFLKLKGTQLSLANAGVPPVYIYRQNKNEVEEIDNQGMPLGAISNYPYKETKTELSKGDVIFLLSDGFPELSNNEKEIFGYERVRKTFKEAADNSAEEIIERLKNAVNVWSGGRPHEDDITFVVIKIK